MTTVNDDFSYRHAAKEADRIAEVITALQSLLKDGDISADLGTATDNCICELDDALEARNKAMDEWESK